MQGCWPCSHRGENSASDPAASPSPAEGKGIQQGCRGWLGKGVPAPTAISSRDQRQELPLQGLCSTKHSRTPSPPRSPHHRQKIRLNPSFVFLIILNLCHKARGPGAVYLHPPRYLFGNNIMFSLKQVLSPRRVPACARVCVFCLSSGLHFLMDGWGFRALFLRWCIKCIYYSLSPTSRKESFVFIQRNEYNVKPEE